jgi:hypothetical protein
VDDTLAAGPADRVPAESYLTEVDTRAGGATLSPALSVNPGRELIPFLQPTPPVRSLEADLCSEPALDAEQVLAAIVASLRRGAMPRSETRGDLSLV